MGRYFEEYEAGQIIETPRRTIVDSDIWAFAGLTADFNPLHCDDIFAAEHHFGDRVTHGPMLIGMAFGLGARAGMFDGTALGLLGIEWSFSAPVRPGDTVHALFYVKNTRATSKGQNGVVAFEVHIVKQDGVVAQIGRPKILFKLRHPAPVAV